MEINDGSLIFFKNLIQTLVTTVTTQSFGSSLGFLRSSENSVTILDFLLRMNSKMLSSINQEQTIRFT